VDLGIVEFSYDELNRVFQQDQYLFIPTGVTNQRTPSLTEGPLTSGDGKITTRYEYDRNSRRTFVVDDNINTARTFYDGAGRLTKALDPESNAAEWAYDGSGNTIETRLTDLAQTGGITNETLLATYFYDSLNRLQR
jgi:YD repeat-containing protein